METIATTEAQFSSIQPDAEVSQESLETATADAVAVDSLEEAQLSPEYLQRKLYFLVDQLKKMHAQLPE